MRTKQHIPALLGLSFSFLAAISTAALAGDSPAATNSTPETAPTWEHIRKTPMQGDLKLFWNVKGGDWQSNDQQAAAHGYSMVTLVGSYSGIANTDNLTNPWKKPESVERNVRRNIGAFRKSHPEGEIIVQDIEFPFEGDIEKAWKDTEARDASRKKSKDGFASRYLPEWATWFWLPCQWTKLDLPGVPVGLYGPQPFNRDYHGVAGKTAQQIDGTHVVDGSLWWSIDPHVDFYIASVYVFYDDPGSIFYIAANVEENYLRTRRYGKKPLYAYEWLRYHASNTKLADQELNPYLVEAMAVLPYFCGAKGIVLYGEEAKRKGQSFQTLPLFTDSLGRVSDLSAKLSKAELVIDEPAHVLWKAKRPLVRKMKVSEAEWVVLAVNPWQAEDVKSTVKVECGKRTVELPVHGRHTGIFVVQNGRVTKK